MEMSEKAHIMTREVLKDHKTLLFIRVGSE